MTIAHALIAMALCVSAGMLAGYGIGVAVKRPHYQPYAQRDAKGRFSRTMPEQTREGDR